MKKVFDNIAIIPSIQPVTITASTNGAAVDTQGYNDGMVQILAGDIDTASGNETYAFSVEDSLDGSTGWAAVSGLTNTVIADNTQKEIRLAELNVVTKRYIRVVATLGGTTPSFLGCAVVVLGNKNNSPVGNA